MLLFAATAGFGQTGNPQQHTYFPNSDSLKIDSLSLVPETVEVLCFFHGQVAAACTDSIDHWNATLYFSGDIPDSVQVKYQTFPYAFSSRWYHKDPDELRQADLDLTPYEIKANDRYDPFADLDGLQYSGSLVRGLSFGNNQDVVLNSSFNLQMSGMLQNDVEITAAITDNNIPIQPEGNTQQLQEFDKVFIRLSKDKQSLTVGDFDMIRPSDYFLNYYKRTQGALYEGGFQTARGDQIITTAGLASSRGIYTRQNLAVTEGNQGPYKLTGNNGELFIIVLAGTERIWIDGKLLTRGAENDYVIDYNAGEITFTPKQLINKDKRVQIEFEYSDKSYFRSVVTSNTSWTNPNEKTTYRLHVYSEQDSKNQPLDLTLDSAARAAMVAAGDDPAQAFIPGIDTAGFSTDRILYRLTDSLGYDSVFVYSTDPELAMYALSFTELGTNKGNYILSSTLANGRVYKWIAPVAGVPQGTAEPVILLRTPISRRMITIAADHKTGDHGTIGAEAAFTQNDLNTFSDAGNDDNTGLGTHVYYNHKTNLSDGKILEAGIDYEYITRDFQFIERYRPVEFNRDWNLQTTDKQPEHYAAAGISLSDSSGNRFQAGTSLYARETAYTGFRQSVNWTQYFHRWKLLAGSSLVNASDDSTSTTFLRPDLTFSRSFAKMNGLEAGFRYWAEHNRFSSADSLRSGAFYFDEYQAFIRTPDTSASQFYTEAIVRHDGLPEAGVFKRVNEGFTWNMGGNLPSGRNRLNWLLTWRTLDVLDTTLSQQQDESALLGRLQYGYTTRKGWLTSDIFYELGTGQEPKREYTFVEVEPGQGNYTWFDYNNDGLQQLDEFEVAIYADQATYIQVFLPTSEYIQANVSQFNYVLNLQPRAVWSDVQGIRDVIARFSLVSSMQLSRKVLDDGSFLSYAPVGTVADTQLVSSNAYWQSTLYFNRTNTRFGAEYTFLQTEGKVVLINGPETRDLTRQNITIRWKITDPLVLSTGISSGLKSLESIAFSGRSYRTPFVSLEPKITYINGAQYRISLSYLYKSTQNESGAESLDSHTGLLDLRYNVPGNSTVSSRISYTLADFNGVADSPVGFALLEGLQDGQNILWNLQFDKRLSQVLQMTLSYDGRKTGSADIVHTGRVQMRAIF
ncbi:MAG: hypothetical protein H6546_07935 [Chitinophagales bacterium]|nr:hypothetical protein [Chitinophagales bacterium]MCB9031018.1 hypothetical protein [Chitinophagales bacterium]HRX22583.1 hypothetical protein [Chitinophagales bacterium]